MIHDGGDNYADDPKPLGGGGGRIACGVIRARASPDAREINCIVAHAPVAELTDN